MADEPTQPNEPTSDSEQSEGLLYHYTDQNGLDGILSSDLIWATHSQFLNDLTERKIGFDIYHRVLERVLNSKQRSLPGSIDVWKKILSNYFEATEAYTVSFSGDRDNEKPGQAGDRLSQWRGYTSGRQGYCMGFRRRSIDEIAKTLPKALYLAGFLEDCDYSTESMTDDIESSTREHFDNILTIKDDYFKSHPLEASYRPYDDPDVHAAIRKYAGDMLLQCSIFKHSGFIEENETRMIVVFINGVSNCNLIEYRTGHIVQTPYIKIPIGIRQDSSLSRILIGPSANQEQAVAILRIRLLQMGLPDVEVVPSIIPYRNW
jgi:hypothetical protein